MRRCSVCIIYNFPSRTSFPPARQAISFQQLRRACTGSIPSICVAYHVHLKELEKGDNKMIQTSLLSTISKAILGTLTIPTAFPRHVCLLTRKDQSCRAFARCFAGLVISMLVITNVGSAQSSNSSVTQSLTLEVKPISRLSVTGDPKSLVITDTFSGSNAISVSDENTRYSLTTNLDNMKIVASINDRMPTGTRLMIKLSSSKAASTGLVDLSSALSPVDVVTGLSRTSEMNQSISYTFAANSDVNEIPTQTRVVTLTLTN